MKDSENIAVLKLSSGVVLHQDGIGIDREAVKRCAEQIANVNELFQPVLVVGGAVGAGRGFLAHHGIRHDDMDLQEIASYGTAEISLAFRDELIARGIKSGQVLANHREMYAGSVLMQGLLHGIRSGNAYTINENDQENLFELQRLATEEKTVRAKQAGIDNDRLAARLSRALVAEAIEEQADDFACHLVMLTNVGGFVLDNVIQTHISGRDREALYAACDDGTSMTGSGGMRVKLDACFEALQGGAATVRMASPAQNWLHVLQGHGEAGKVTRVVQ